MPRKFLRGMFQPLTHLSTKRLPPSQECWCGSLKTPIVNIVFSKTATDAYFHYFKYMRQRLSITVMAPKNWFDILNNTGVSFASMSFLNFASTANLNMATTASTKRTYISSFLIPLQAAHIIITVRNEHKRLIYEMLFFLYLIWKYLLDLMMLSHGVVLNEKLFISL